MLARQGAKHAVADRGCLPNLNLMIKSGAADKTIMCMVYAVTCTIRPMGERVSVAL